MLRECSAAIRPLPVHTEIAPGVASTTGGAGGAGSAYRLGSAVNLARHFALQKQYGQPTCSAWCGDCSVTVMPQTGSFTCAAFADRAVRSCPCPSSCALPSALSWGANVHRRACCRASGLHGRRMTSCPCSVHLGLLNRPAAVELLGAVHRGAPFQRRSSSALLTTLTLLKAIAAPAITGFSKPSAASGTPTTL